MRRKKKSKVKMADEPPQKRARTEGSEEPTKNKREYVYIVNRTDFNDDYKARGDDWSREEFLGVFRTFESATRKMVNDQVEMIIEQFNQDNHEELAGKYEKSRSKIGKYRVQIEYDRESIMKDLDSLVETVLKGEFVNVKCDWNLVKQEVRD
jgi:mRNA-degrading endonuclease RelE of RelBE toxin-antitoxin system